MNIKKLVKSQRIRHAILRLGKYIPDSLMLRLQYRLLRGRWPDLKHPKRFTEWIQVYKMKYRNPVMLECVDKYAVRRYVAECIGEQYLAKLYQVCKSADDVNFNDLPEKFVIKSTSGGSGDNVLLVKDKSCLDIKQTIRKVNSWLKKDYSDTSREWAYTEAARNPRIIVEEFLESDSPGGLDDYKFFCFNGKCRFFKVDFNRFINHQANYYWPGGDMIDVIEEKFRTDKSHRLQEPHILSNMMALAEKLSEGFPFVRVDMYNIGERIIFGELTFYPGSGYGYFTPDSFDYEFGKFFPDITK